MKIPYGRQWIDQDDIEAVVKVLQSDWLTQGPDVSDFERAFAEYIGCQYAVAFNSGTSALHGAMYAAGVGEGDETITTPITFVASANCGMYLGARPVLSDISLDTYCIDIDKIEEKITEKTKVIVPVDLAGYPVDIERIMAIAEKHNLIVVEDAAHALGAFRNGVKVGNKADMTMFSFHPVKHITTAEGGIITTNDPAYYESLNLFRSHGITKDPNRLEKNDGPWYYEMQKPGYNYRITDMQCALGLTQLQKIEKFIKRRIELADRYDQAFEENSMITTPPRPEGQDSRHVFHIYPILLDESLDRKEVFLKLREKGILCQVHYVPVNHHPFYKDRFGYKEQDFEQANNYYKRVITIPLFPKMTDEEQLYVIKTINELTEP